MKIPVFDIDWTLVAKPKKKVHHDAFIHSFNKLYGVKTDDKGFREGSLDNQIIIESLEKNGVDKKEIVKNLDNIRNEVVKYFMDHKNENEFIPLPGVVDLLKILKEKKIPAGLLTGNIYTIGWEKMKMAGLRDYLSFGAFGNMALERSDLVNIAAMEVSKILNRKVAVSDIVVIGDTPLDVVCAKKAGAYSIAVASGLSFKLEDLKKTGADLVVESLEEKEKILNFIEH
jgi:phosphoglycolate phosphatase